jgi:hypothetical protein
LRAARATSNRRDSINPLEELNSPFSASTQLFFGPRAAISVEMMEYRTVSHKKSDSLNQSSEENLVLIWGKYSVASFLIEGSSD